MSKNKSKEARRSDMKQNYDWREKLVARIAELSTIKPEFVLCEEEAAAFLNVSLEYVEKLIANGKLPESMTVKEVALFKQNRDANRKTALKELTDMSQGSGSHDSDSD